MSADGEMVRDALHLLGKIIDSDDVATWDRASAALDRLERERDSLEHQRDVLIVYCDEEVERLIQFESQSVTRIWDKVRDVEAERDAALAENSQMKENAEFVVEVAAERDAALARIADLEVQLNAVLLDGRNGWKQQEEGAFALAAVLARVDESERALSEIEYAATRELVNSTLIARIARDALDSRSTTHDDPKGET